MKKLVIFTLLLSIVAMVGITVYGCDRIARPSTNIDAKQGPACDRPEFYGSLICSQLRANGIANAEDVRDLILDANDAAILLDAYTVDQLEDMLKQWDTILDSPMSYALYLSRIVADTSKARALSNIFERRFGYLLDIDSFITQADVKLLKLLNQRIREAVGIDG